MLAWYYALMSSSGSLPLGRRTGYQDRYDPKLLNAIPREHQRQLLGLTGALPFTGLDIWNAYELSWLNSNGKPQIALAAFAFPCESPNLIESKSCKLYLNSFSQTDFAAPPDVERHLARDLSTACGGSVEVSLLQPEQFTDTGFGSLEGESLDSLEIRIETYQPQPAFLGVCPETADETLSSNLLKSNCPVTGQPDWGSVQIRYRGPRIDRAGLLRYIVSFRQCTGFHEQIVERMFVDILRMCRPEELSIYARYTRRGGLDINPFRTNAGEFHPPNRRTARQ